MTFYESTPGSFRGFCRVCGSPVVNKFDERSRSASADPSATSLLGVALATLDDDPGIRPDAHAFIASKAPWFTITDDLPQYPARNPRTKPTESAEGKAELKAVPVGKPN